MSAKKEKARQRRITTARDLEGRGHVDHAVKEFLRAKVPGEAARLLAKQGRLQDAGQAILDGLKVTIDEVGELSANDRVLVEQVVLFFEHGHAAAMAEKLKAALASAPPPSPDTPDRALPVGPVETVDEAPRSAAPARKAPATKTKPPPAAAKPKPPPAADAAPPAAGKTPPPERRQINKLPDPGEYVPPAKARPSMRSPANSGSFRPPSKVTTSSGGFRAPSRASFRPPASSGSFRPPARAKSPAVDHPAKSGERPTPAAITGQSSRPPRKPAEPNPSAPVISTGSFVKPGARPPAAESKKASSKPPRRPTATPVPESKPPPSTPAPEPKPAAAPKVEPKRPAKRAPRTSSPQLSASGEVITEYAGSREQGWRGAGQEALEKSIEEHLAAGRKGAAARIAREAGQYDRALEWFEELGLHHQAGACLRAIGRYDEALVMLMKQDIKSANYRKACFELVAVAKELGTKLDFDYDRFLTRFIEQGPNDRDEISTYLDLAHIYLANGFTGAAKRCLRKVLASDPQHAEAKELDEQLRRAARASSNEAPRASLPASARGLPPLPSLEEFIELARAHAPQE